MICKGPVVQRQAVHWELLLGQCSQDRERWRVGWSPSHVDTLSASPLPTSDSDVYFPQQLSLPEMENSGLQHRAIKHRSPASAWLFS